MKKFILILLFFPVLTMAQSMAILNLHFTSPKSDSCILRLESYYIDEFDPKVNFSIISSLKIETINPFIGKLVYDKQSVLLFFESGDTLDLTISNDSLNKAIICSGKGSEQNNFLHSFYREFMEDYDKERIKQRILNTNLDAFEMSLYEQRKKQLAWYNQHDRSKFSKAFSDYMEQTIRYNYFANLLSYPIVIASQSTSILTLNPLPEVMLENVNSKLVNNGSLICSAYRDFINMYIVYFTSKANGFKKFTDYNISMDRKVSTARHDLKGETLIWYIANFLNTDCDKVTSHTAQRIYGELKTLEKNGDYSQVLKPKLEARIKRKDSVVKEDNNKNGSSAKNEGNPFGGVELKDMNGKVFKPGYIKGKVVFVDFWASWCGPCRQEFPASKQLHDRFTEKQLQQIVFLYISIDGNEGQWKKAVQSIGMDGILLISPGDWQSPVVKYFGINSIPHYLLIDKTGKITNTNAPRPSSGDTIYNEILKLLH